jgi:hypothetical protein
MQVPTSVAQKAFDSSHAFAAPGAGLPALRRSAARAVRRAKAVAKPPAQPEAPPAQQLADHATGDDHPTITYIGGVQTRTKYTTKDVLNIMAGAFSTPFSSFGKSAADVYGKIVHGAPLSGDQKSKIESYALPGDIAAWLVTLGIQPIAGMTLRAAAASLPDPEAGQTGSSQQSSAGQPLARPQDRNPPMPAPVPVPVPVPVRQGVAALKRLQGEGPVNLEPARDENADLERIRQFTGKSLGYYRNDKDISSMQSPSAAAQASYDARRGVLTVGKGGDATSFVPDGKAYLGRGWLPPADGPSALAGTDVIKLGAGNGGVAALNMRFADLAPGTTTIVTGGPMRGSTMLFAADDQGFYAYHAGVPPDNPQWRMAEEGAQSIVNADRTMRMGSGLATSSAPRDARDDLVSAAKQYPFSALIYDGAYPTDPTLRTPDQRIDVPVHANGTDAARRPWRMMTYSYFVPDIDVRSVGTAEAVISKDKDGTVSVGVLGEKGRLDHMTTLDLHGGSVAFRYRTIDGATDSYTPPASAQ